MISTFLLYSIQCMLNSCERLSATVTAKKVTLILSTIVLLQGLPAGSTEQAQGVTAGGGWGWFLVHLPASAPAVCWEAATPTLCLPHEGSSWWVRAPISLCQSQQHFVLYQCTLMQGLACDGLFSETSSYQWCCFVLGSKWETARVILSSN